MEALSWLLSSDESDDQRSQGQKVTLVFFIGGVTFAEVSAFRFLSHLNYGTWKLLFWTLSRLYCILQYLFIMITFHLLLLVTKIYTFVIVYLIFPASTSYVVATTNMINGNTWLESLSENLKNLWIQIKHKSQKCCNLSVLDSIMLDIPELMICICVAGKIEPSITASSGNCDAS